MFFLSPLITTFIKGKNIKTMAVSFFVSGLINQFLHRNYCVPTQPVKETIIKDIISGIQTVIQNIDSVHHYDIAD
jgi:hypothetical protein